MTKKMIPCRVCGKDFEPCAYCQSYADTFRWRNFACSKDCAYKYIEEVTNYRNSLHEKRESLEEPSVEEISKHISEQTVGQETYIPKKRTRKTSVIVSEEKRIQNTELE